MQTHPIRHLIEQGEHQQLDFKFEIADSLKIARTLVAFANTDGGTLLIGVKDNGVIAGIRSGEEMYMAEAAAKMYCMPEVPVAFKEWEINGKTVLEITVPISPLKPHFVIDKEKKKQAFIRVKDQNFACNSVLLRVWERQKKFKGAYIRYTDAEKILLEYLSEHDDISLPKFCKIATIKRKKAENVLVNFLLTQSIEITFSETGTRYKLKSNASI